MLARIARRTGLKPEDLQEGDSLLQSQDLGAELLRVVEDRLSAQAYR